MRIEPRFLFRFPDLLFALLAMISTGISIWFNRPWGIWMTIVGAIMFIAAILVVPNNSGWIFRILIGLIMVFAPLLSDMPLSVRLLIWVITIISAGLLTAWTLWGAPINSVLVLDLTMTLALIIAAGASLTLTFWDTVPTMVWICWTCAGPVAGFVCHLMMRGSEETSPYK